MSLSIHPDPAARAGGFAFLALPEGRLAGEAVTVSVMESYGGRWLAPAEAEGEAVAVGNPNWQPERFEFGPYPIHRHEGCDWVRIGPEIVNKIEAYTPLRITVGGVVEDLAWPDNVPPRAGAAVLGAVRTIGRGRPEAAAGAAVAPPSGPPVAAEPVAAPRPAPVPEPTPVPQARPGTQARATTGRRWIVPVLLTLLVLAAILAGLLYLPGDADRNPPAPVVQGDRCSPAAVAATPGGFAAVIEAARGCADRLTPDNVLAMLETAAASGDAAALTLFGVLYDDRVTDAAIEDRIGLTFEDDAARAAEYYHRAVAAGSDAAAARLAETCERLAAATGTLERGAHDDFCK